MKFSEKFMMRGFLFAAPIVLGSTMAIAPSRAASIASSSATLTLGNFTLNSSPATGFDPSANTSAVTNAIAPNGTANATANGNALTIPTLIQQSSDATASGSGQNYFASGKGNSETALSFDQGCGCFQFDFQATLRSIAQLTNPVLGEKAAANSFVAFKVFDGNELIDWFKASYNGSSLIGGSSDSISIASLADQNGVFTIDGSYNRHIGQDGTLTVKGFTGSKAVATVPEPPMFAALIILPGLMWLKRRKAKAIPQEVISDRRSQ